MARAGRGDAIKQIPPSLLSRTRTCTRLRPFSVADARLGQEGDPDGPFRNRIGSLETGRGRRLFLDGSIMLGSTSAPPWFASSNEPVSRAVQSGTFHPT